MPRTRVKFCGIMSPDDARAAADAGADAVGMILHADARRRIDLKTAAEIVTALPPYVMPVGLFVDAQVADIRHQAKSLGLGMVQLHGNETPDTVNQLGTIRTVKVFKVRDGLNDELFRWWEIYARGGVPNLAGVLLDSAGGGGTGVANDFGAIRQLLEAGRLDGLPPLIVAGGLNPENVGQVVADLRPYAVDTSSGIEIDYGKKSVDKMQAFTAAVRAAS